jgi:hypothetical protein
MKIIEKVKLYTFDTQFIVINNLILTHENIDEIIISYVNDLRFQFSGEITFTIQYFGGSMF